MPYNDISAAELPAFIMRENPAVLDMRDAPSYVRGHIPGARLLTDAAIRALRGSSRPLVLYCYHGVSSRDMARLLVRAGFTVFNLEGGWQAWQQQHAAPAPAPSARLAAWCAAQGFAEADAFAPNDAGLTPLMQAALDGEQAIVDELLSVHGSVELVNGDGNTALWFACKGEHAQIMRSLIAQGADIDHANREGVTCLIYAASAGKLVAVRTLLEAGASLAPETLDGFTALDCAASLPVLRLLRSHAGQVGMTRGSAQG